MSRPTLEIIDLNVRLPRGADRKYAVQGLNLSVKPREIVCIVGESGSGKSVTASAVMGLLNPDALTLESGTIRLAGQDITRLPQKEMRALRGHRMAMIFQEPMTALNPLMRVGDQIAEVFEFHDKSMSREQVDERVLALLRDVHLPTPETLRFCRPHQLSGGQRQRVMIAMALAMKPALIVADEPTTALDVTSQAQVLRLLHELRGNHDNGVLFITHDFDVVEEIADQVIVMQHGVVVESGPASEVLGNPQHPYTQRLVAAVPSGVPKAPPLGAAPVLLDVRNLNLSFDTGGASQTRRRIVQALSDVSFTLHRGETLGVVGESGSGKTTLGRCLARLAQPSSGAILLNGQDITQLSSREWRLHCKKVQMIFQDPFRSFNPRIKIGRALAEGPLNFGADKTKLERQMRQMLELVSLDAGALERYPHEFSGGQRQRISIARALMMEPEILVADEAVSALDVSVQAQILDLLEDIRERLGLTMIFITHDLRVAARLSHRIAVMQQGKLMELDSARNIFEAPQSAYTQSLLAAIPARRSHGMAVDLELQQA